MYNDDVYERDRPCSHDNDENGNGNLYESTAAGSCRRTTTRTGRALAAPLLPAEYRPKLRSHATRQLDWILGLNPYDACLLQGFGRNNPPSLPGAPNAFGGVANGITAGFDDEHGIAFLPPPCDTDERHNWRWSEQWLPHAAWLLLALALAVPSG